MNQTCNIFYNKHSGPQRYPLGTACPSGADWFATLEEYQAWLDSQEPGKTLDEARAAKLAALMSAYEAAFGPVSSVYPGIEREGWFLQREEALKVLAGGESEIINQWVVLRGAGETPQEFAGVIMQNYAQWSFLYSTLTPMQQKMYREINALTSPAAVQAYEIKFNIQGAE